MLRKLGLFAARKPLVVIALWVALLTVSAIAAFQGFGAGNLFERMTTSAPGAPNSESARAADLIETTNGGETAIIRVDGAWQEHRDDLQQVLDDNLSADNSFSYTSPLVAPQEYLDAVAAATEEQVTAQVAEQINASMPPGTPQEIIQNTIDQTIAENLPNALAEAEAIASEDYLDQIPELKELTTDDSAAIIVQQEHGDFTEEQFAFLDETVVELNEIDESISSEWSYAGAVAEQMTHQSSEDLKKGEIISLPLALIVMLIIFGGFLAAGLPLVATGAAIVSGLATLWGLSFFLDMDTTVMSVITVIGMGVSIDYGLLFISRYRELLRDHEVTDKEELKEVIAKTVDSSGRTIIFSALTIAIAVAGLLAFPIPFMKGIAVSASVVVLLAAFAVITLLPAILSLLGLRMTKKSPLTKIPGFGFLVKRLGDVTPTDGFFSKIVALIKKAPFVWLIASIAILLGLGSSITSLHVASSGTPYLATEEGAYGFFEKLKEIPAFEASSATLVMESPDDFTAWESVLAEENIDYTHEEDAETVTFPTEDPLALRELRDAQELPGLITGITAEDYDFNQALLQGLPLAIAIVFLATFILLFLLTGSLFMPLQAILFSALSLGASVGVLTWGFEGGGLSGLLGFDPSTITGLSPIILVLAIVFGFGLATDYSVFLLGRLTEDRSKLLLESGQPTDKKTLDEIAVKAVSTGLQSTGRVITSAGFIIVLVFLGFTLGDLFMIKQIGVALAAAVLVDMILVRTIAVPATLLIMKEKAWWAPRWLKNVQERFAIKH